MKKNYKKIAVILAIMALISVFFSINCFASGTPATTISVADAVEQVSDGLMLQGKQIVNNVVFPIITFVLAVVFIALICLAVFNYRKNGKMEWTGIIISGACLAASIAAPPIIWMIVGI